jgi:hypothetical protein
MDAQALKDLGIGAELRTVVAVQWVRMNSLVAKHFGLKYLELIERTRDTRILIRMTEGQRLSEADREAYEEAKEDGYIAAHALRDLFVGLAEDGVIPYADYLVDLSW